VIAREIEQLKGVSERLESLADSKPCCSGRAREYLASIRDIATILDVFVVIKSRPEGSLLDFDDHRAGYLIDVLRGYLSRPGRSPESLPSHIMTLASII